MRTQWQVDRGQLNHNWLQNVVLVGLNHALGIAADTVRPRHVRVTIAEDILRWPERRNEVTALLARFETEMSPTVFFECLPLSRVSIETKKWLLPLTHELWLRRYEVRQKVSSAQALFVAAEQSYDQVSKALEQIPESARVEEIRPLAPLLKKFTRACEALSGAISAFPREISCS